MPSDHGPTRGDIGFSEFAQVPGYVWGHRHTFGPGGFGPGAPYVVVKLGGPKDPKVDLGPCPLPPDVAPELW